ncbi:ABC transporter ATP-binding protein [Anaerocolumna xylanovorans]|uniref:ATP-binding cassette, subfamily B, MsbA n=1 Tax=Anaerocolumna xylanovorans DSM 12503 TaxID=1121345 RepID=A0A1M7YMM6_9FIRM|nr:ABC transporter ATP-binding protein [Anaerocolumna xylanovorans]SHO53818.1 ATP-binding cassette, subfamily B, MsbA [Anaerocolumna xylanovorans DSM 12503]
MKKEKKIHRRKRLMFPPAVSAREVAGLFLTAMIFVLVTVVEIAITYIIKTTIDVNNSKNIYKFLDFIPVVIGLAIVYGLGKFLAAKRSVHFSAKIVKNEKVRLSEHIQKLPLNTVKKYNAGELYTTIHENMLSVEEYIKLLPGAIASPVIILMTMAVMFWYSWKLTLVCIISIPVPTLLFGIINKPIEKKAADNQDNIGGVNYLLKCTIEGLDIIKTYHLFDMFSSKFHKQLIKVKDKSLEIEKIKTKASPLNFFLRIFPQCVIPLYCAYLAMRGEGTIGLLPAFSLLIVNIFVPIETLLRFSTKYRETLSPMQKVEELYSLEEERTGGILPLIDSDSVVDFSNVYFAYSDVNVLEGITFSVKKNQLIAIVGESGSGKSSIIKLISGLYEDYKGSVKVFNREVCESDLSELRKQIAVMTQTAFLLPESIEKNLLYSVESYEEEEIAKAMTMANLNEVINKLPDGSKTILTERGMNLSKGQRQRIAMARVILRKAPLIILDEATSGLDPLSVETILNSLNVLKQNHTIVMVTHDIQLASNADEIILVHNHRIVQGGSHEELMKNSMYQSMYMIQN